MQTLILAFGGMCGLFPALPVNWDSRINELFSVWEREQKETQSLIVEFTRTISIGNLRLKRHNGTFKLLRTPQGELSAYYEIRDIDGPSTRTDCVILVKGELYLLDHDQKIAARIPTGRNVLQFLSSKFDPCLILLDRQLAQKTNRLQIAQKDEWYTYLTMEPKQSDAPWRYGRVVSLNKPTTKVGKGLPKQFYCVDGAHEYTVDINAWRKNPPDAPKPEEFTPPQERPGWKVHEWGQRTKPSQDKEKVWEKIALPKSVLRATRSVAGTVGPRSGDTRVELSFRVFVTSCRP